MMFARRFIRWACFRRCSGNCSWKNSGWSGYKRRRRWRIRFPDGRAALLQYSLEETARDLGADGNAWRRMFAPFLEDSAGFFAEILNRFAFRRGRY